MAGQVQVREKNEGEKIEWRQKGARLYFGDDDLILRCDTRQREYPVHEDISMDENGNLTLGEGKYYVAEVDIPAYSYAEPEEDRREILPLDMADVVLTLWSMAGLHPVN